MFRALLLGPRLPRAPFLGVAAGSAAALACSAAVQDGAPWTPPGAVLEWLGAAVAALAAHVLVVALIRRSRDARVSPLLWAAPSAALAACSFRWPGMASYGADPVPALSALALGMVLLVGLLPGRGPALPAEKTLVL